MNGPAEPRSRTARALYASTWVAALAFVAFLCTRAVRLDPDVVARLSSADVGTVAAIAFSMSAVMILNGLILRDLVSHFRISMPARIWLGLTLSSSLLNLVSPVRGGVAARAIYLKQMYALRYADFACVQSASLVFTLFTTSCVALGSILALGIPGGSAGYVALVFCVLVAAAPPFFLSFAPAIEGRIGRLPGIVLRMYEGWLSIRNDTELLARLLIWNVAAVCCHSLAFVFAFDVAGFEGHWLVPVASSAFARFGTLIAITPAGLGVFEAFGVVSATVAGAEIPAALLAVLLVRALASACTIVGGLAFAPVLARTSGYRPAGE